MKEYNVPQLAQTALEMPVALLDHAKSYDTYILTRTSHLQREIERCKRIRESAPMLVKQKIDLEQGAMEYELRSLRSNVALEMRCSTKSRVLQLCTQRIGATIPMRQLPLLRGSVDPQPLRYMTNYGTGFSQQISFSHFSLENDGEIVNEMIWEISQTSMRTMFAALVIPSNIRNRVSRKIGQELQITDSCSPE